MVCQIFGVIVRGVKKSLLVAVQAVAVAGVFGQSAVAQTAEQDIINRVQEPSALKAPVAGPSIQYTSQRAPTNAADITFVLNDLKVEGVSAYQDADLAVFFQDRLGEEIALAELYEIAAKIQTLYREDDFIFTRVIVPAQQIDGGVVRLDVIEAVIEEAVVEEPEEPIGPVKALAERIVSELIGKVNPTGAMLERALFTLNEIPGVTRATAVPQAGKTGRGALSLYVNIERDPSEVVLYADNRQSTGVGQGLVGMIATFNSYTSAGDTTSLALFNSLDYDNKNLDVQERNTFQIKHSRNIGTGGLQVEGQALFSRTRPGDDLAAAGIEGEQILFGVKATQPIISSRQLVMKGTVGLEHVRSTTDVSNGALRVADDNLRVLSFGLDGVFRDEIGYTAFDVSLRKGLDIFGASQAGDELSRADGEADFTLIRGSLERQIVVNEGLSALFKFSGQYSFSPLLAGEEFAIGGTTFGRGFDPSQFTGDHGFGVSGELKYFQSFTFMEERFAFEPYMFAELGYIYNTGDGFPDQQALASLGLGVRLFLPEDLAIAFEYAIPAQGFDTERQIEDETPRFIFNITKRL